MPRFSPAPGFLALDSTPASLTLHGVNQKDRKFWASFGLFLPHTTFFDVNEA